MIPKNIPQDINVELLLSYLSQDDIKVRFGGLHKRNTYHDLIELLNNTDDTLELTVGRNSLYHILPEYMFHPIDRFKDIPKTTDRELFQKEHEAQTQEAENAKKFFAPFDLLLLLLRRDLREQLNTYADSNKVLIDIIGDSLTEEQRQNRFIKQLIPLLPSCKNIRGNNTLLTFLLRKILMEENLRIEPRSIVQEFSDKKPRYQERLLGEVGALYLGDTYQEEATVYTIHYWSDDECTDHFHQFLKELEELRVFIQDYFVAVGDILRFEIVKDEEPTVLSTNEKYYYLNYNTNL